jgi:N-acetylgalactosamine-6-sulfatase
VDDALAFIERHRGRPFYVSLWTLVPHAYLLPTPEELDPYAELEVDASRFEDRMRDYLAGAEDLDEQMKTYAAAITGMDRALGRLFDRLDEWGLAGETLVFFASDNGPEDYHVTDARNAGVGSTGPLRGRKRSLYEGGIRVPCIVRWPAGVPAGRVNRESVLCAIDFLPTVCSITRVSPPESALDGEDLADVLRGSARRRSRPLFWDWRSATVGDAVHHSPPAAIRDGDWKLLADEESSYAELYDLREDPEERRNLASDRPEVAERLRDRLLAWKATLP